MSNAQSIRSNKLSSPEVSEEYQSALSCFSEATLTKVYDLVLNNFKDEDKEEGPKTEHCQSNISKLVALYNNCKASSVTIARIEATPGFKDSIASTAVNRPHMMNNMLSVKASSTSALLPRSQMRRGNIPIERGTSLKGSLLSTTKPGKLQHVRRASISSSSSSASASTGHHHHHLHHNYDGNHQAVGRKLKQQQRNAGAPPPPPLYKGNKIVNKNVIDRKDADGEPIPESALNFLAALNKKKSSVPSKQMKIERQRSLKSGKNQNRRTTSTVQHNQDGNNQNLFMGGSESTCSSIGGVIDKSDKDDGDENKFEDKLRRSEGDEQKLEEDGREKEWDTSDDEPNTSTKRRRLQRQVKNRDGSTHHNSSPKSKNKRQRTTRSIKVNYNDDYEDNEDNLRNDEEGEQRLRGNSDVVYNLGDEVAVYFEKDDQWYEATIQDVKFKNVGRHNKIKDSGNELKVLSYIVEYGNGEVQKNVPPENVLDKLED